MGISRFNFLPNPGKPIPTFRLHMCLWGQQSLPIIITWGWWMLWPQTFSLWFLLQSIGPDLLHLSLSPSLIPLSIEKISLLWKFNFFLLNAFSLSLTLAFVCSVCSCKNYLGRTKRVTLTVAIMISSVFVWIYPLNIYSAGLKINK